MLSKTISFWKHNCCSSARRRLKKERSGRDRSFPSVENQTETERSSRDSSSTTQRMNRAKRQWFWGWRGTPVALYKSWLKRHWLLSRRKSMRRWWSASSLRTQTTARTSKPIVSTTASSTTSTSRTVTLTTKCSRRGLLRSKRRNLRTTLLLSTICQWAWSLWG